MPQRNTGAGSDGVPGRLRINMVRSTLPNISESGTSSGLRGILNELEYGKVSIFQNGEENDSESNESRNIDFHLSSDDAFCAILSQNEHRDDPRTREGRRPSETEPRGHNHELGCFRTPEQAQGPGENAYQMIL